jgi:hypothetical protein
MTKRKGTTMTGMNPVLSKAKTHFAEISNKGIDNLHVPEWDTTVYWKVGGLNFASQSKIIELQQKGQSAEALIEMLIMRALNKDGKKMFRPLEKPILMRDVDPNVILQIVTAMGESDKNYEVEHEDPVGN